jgi:hypothetical protein
MSRTSLSALLPVFFWCAGPMQAREAPHSDARLAEAAAPRANDDDDDGPDYYDGQDAPTGGTVNPESVGAPKEGSDDDGSAPPGPLWLGVAGDGFLSFSQNKRASGYAAFRIGKRFPLFLPLDLYAQTRFDRDQRDIQWDNRVDAGGGLRLSMPRRIPVTLALEAVGGEYLRSPFAMDLPGDGSGVPLGFFMEYRGALQADYSWGRKSENIYAATPFTFPFRYWGRVRSELDYARLSRRESSRTDSEVTTRSVDYQNVSLSLHPDAGFLLMEGMAGNLAAYATAQLRVNTFGEWWNDLAVAGPGFSYQPFPGAELYFKAEYLMGRYLWNGRKSDPRPYPVGIRDLRLFFDLKYDLGI